MDYVIPQKPITSWVIRTKNEEKWYEVWAREESNL